MYVLIKHLLAELLVSILKFSDDNYNKCYTN